MNVVADLACVRISAPPVCWVVQIGPILATSLGWRTVDVGLPQLSMHSAREMCGAKDVKLGADIFAAFYAHYSKLDGALARDGDDDADVFGTK